MLLGIARGRRDWSLVLVGPVRASHVDIARDVELLRMEPNIHFLGEKPQSEVPHYLKGFNVCMLCYRKTEYTKYIYPAKLHEYLASGHPIVATRLPNLEEFADVLRFAEGNDEWLAAIQAALSENNSGLREARIAVARRNSWESRVRLIEELVREQLRRSRGHGASRSVTAALDQW
jgi:glycosyltransferase involved in cell wall biosynthesis